MKKIAYLLIALSAMAFQACKSHSGSSSTDSTSATATDSTKTITTAADTGKTSAVAQATTDSSDVQFANKAAVGGMAEVALGKLALKSSNAKVKDFANMMITDHGAANAELMGIAKTKNIALPATVDAEHQQKMDSLSNLSGKDFDKAYIAAMVAGHKKTLDLMQNEALSGKDADLKAFAAKTAPVVRMHLAAVNKLSAGMK